MRSLEGAGIRVSLGTVEETKKNSFRDGYGVTYDCGDSRWNSRSIMRREARSGASCVERAVSCLQLSDGSAVRHSPHLG